MKRKILIFFITLCLAISPISFVFAADEMEEETTQVEAIQVDKTSSEENKETSTENKEETEEEVKEEIKEDKQTTEKSLTNQTIKTTPKPKVEITTNSTTYVEDEIIKKPTTITRKISPNTKTNVQSNTYHYDRTECYKATVNGEEVDFTTDNTSGVMITVPQENSTIDVEFYYRYIDQDVLYNFEVIHEVYIDCDEENGTPIYTKKDNQQQLYAGEQWTSISMNNGSFGFFKIAEVPKEYQDVYFYLASPSIEGGQSGTVKGDYNLQDGYPSNINHFTMIHDDTIMRYVYSAAGTVAIKYIDTEGNEIAKSKRYGSYPSIPYSSNFFTPLELENYNFVETQHSITDLVYKAGINEVIYHIYSLIQPPIPDEPEPEPEPDSPSTPNKPMITPTQPTKPITDNTIGAGDGEPIRQVRAATPVNTNAITINPPTTPTTKPEVEKITIKNNKAPKVEPQGAWALINLIATILGCIIALIAICLQKKSDNEEYTEDEESDIRKMRFTKIASFLIEIISIIIFILTEDMSLPMILVDKWTILMIILFIIEIVNFCITKKYSNENEKEIEK